jgi:hypothetical protein
MHCIRGALRVPRTWDSLFEHRIARATEPKAWPWACKGEMEQSVRQRTGPRARTGQDWERDAASLNATCYCLGRGPVDFEEPR